MEKGEMDTVRWGMGHLEGNCDVEISAKTWRWKWLIWKGRSFICNKAMGK